MTRWPLVLAALLVVLALVETGAAVVAPRRVPTDADWRAAAAAVRAGFRPGDLIVIAPAWADQVGRQHLGDLMTREMVGRSDADRYARIWEVSIRDARAPETATATGAVAEDEAWHGRVRVARFRRAAPPVAVTYDFTARLADALVTQAPADGRGDERPCWRDPHAADDGFHCAATHVGRRTLEIDYRPRLGVLVPVDDSLVTRLEFPAAPLGATLVVYAGLHDYYARKSADGRVEVAVFVDDARVLEMGAANGDAWRRFTVDTARFAGAPHRVRFEVRATAPAWRNLGLHAEARG